jgi:hypothetical protein
MADKAKPKPDPVRPDCWLGSPRDGVSHAFSVFVQGEPSLLVTYCTRCGTIAEVQEEKP